MGPRLCCTEGTMVDPIYSWLTLSQLVVAFWLGMYVERQKIKHRLMGMLQDKANAK